MSAAIAGGLRRRSIAFAMIAIATAAILAIGLATVRSLDSEPEAAHSTPANVPSISDLMIATIQPRHERLWRAAQDGNWDFAAYELGNLKGAFNRLGHAHPTEHDISFRR
jgi:Rieske Fe-S protein